LGENEPEERTRPLATASVVSAVSSAIAVYSVDKSAGKVGVERS
jgi:hypothetical protein